MPWRHLCVTATHWPRILALLCLCTSLPAPLAAQEADYSVYTDSPRLFLNQRRLRLLKRERERESLRWMQFDSLMAGQARMAEPGFALALYGILTGRTSYCEEAGKWALSSSAARPAETRQAALVYDWCLDAMPDAQSMELARRLTASIRQRPTATQEVRSSALIAIAIADVEPRLSQQFLRYTVEDWWRGKILPLLKAGEQPFPTRTDLFAMVEIIHAVRDNLRIDLREGAEKWFDELPSLLLLSYYPQPWPAPENEYRIPAYDGAGEPDTREAAIARAAELALVAYDTNAQPHQFLQGWLLMDRFLMRGAYGITYELLWANPYQPGLSYTYMPDLFHSNGRLMVRSGWDEDASWFSYDNGKMQAFRNGARVVVKPGSSLAPIALGPTKIFFAPSGTQFETGWLPPPEEGARRDIEEIAFVIGLERDAAYDVEVDGMEMSEERTDSGGILELHFQPGRKAGVRIRKFNPQTQ